MVYLQTEERILKTIMLITLMLVTFGQCLPTSKITKRMAAEDHGVIEYPEYQPGVQYDEYPVIVPKRAALLLDRMMVALQKAIEDEESALQTNKIGRDSLDGYGGSKVSQPKIMPTAEETMGLQRRGHGGNSGVSGQQHKGRNYWRCYFNAVTCF